MIMAVLGLVLAAEPARAQGLPHQEDAVRLRQPPEDAPHGPAIGGLSLGIWSEKQTYGLNARMNVWKILANTDKDAAGRTRPYDQAILKDDCLTITDSAGKQTTIRDNHDVWDGPVGCGFAESIFTMLQEQLRHPGVYRLQWKIGRLESNMIEIRVLPAVPAAPGKAQPQDRNKADAPPAAR